MTNSVAFLIFEIQWRERRHASKKNIDAVGSSIRVVRQVLLDGA